MVSEGSIRLCRLDNGKCWENTFLNASDCDKVRLNINSYNIRPSGLVCKAGDGLIGETSMMDIDEQT